MVIDWSPFSYHWHIQAIRVSDKGFLLQSSELESANGWLSSLRVRKPNSQGQVYFLSLCWIRHIATHCRCWTM